MEVGRTPGGGRGDLSGPVSEGCWGGGGHRAGTLCWKQWRGGGRAAGVPVGERRSRSRPAAVSLVPLPLSRPGSPPSSPGFPNLFFGRLLAGGGAVWEEHQWEPKEQALPGHVQPQRGGRRRRKGERRNPGAFARGGRLQPPGPLPVVPSKILGNPGLAPPCQPHFFTTREVWHPHGCTRGLRGAHSWGCWAGGDPTSPGAPLWLGAWGCNPFFWPKSRLKWGKKKSRWNVSGGGAVGGHGGRVARRRAVAQAHTCSFPTPSAAAPGGKHTGRPRPRESRGGHIPPAWHGRAARRPTTPACPPGAPCPSLPGDPVTAGDPPWAGCLSAGDPIAVPPRAPHWGLQLSPCVCCRSLGDLISLGDLSCPPRACCLSPRSPGPIPPQDPKSLGDPSRPPMHATCPPGAIPPQDPKSPGDLCLLSPTPCMLPVPLGTP